MIHIMRVTVIAQMSSIPENLVRIVFRYPILNPSVVVISGIGAHTTMEVNIYFLRSTPILPMYVSPIGGA